MRTQKCKEGQEWARMDQMSVVGPKGTGEHKNEVRGGTDDGHTTGACMMVSGRGKFRKIQIYIVMVHLEYESLAENTGSCAPICSTIAEVGFCSMKSKQSSRIPLRLTCEFLPKRFLYILL